MDEALIDHIFTFHKATPEQAAIYDALTDYFRWLARKLNEKLPEGPGKTVAIRKLSDARMAANAAVALEGRF